MARYPGFEITPLFSHNSDLTVDDLLAVIEDQDPVFLPNIRRLSDPEAAATPDLSAIEYSVEIPGDAHVLRVMHQYSNNTYASQVAELQRAHNEALRLDTIGREEGIPHLLLPHATFLSIADPHARAHLEPQVRPPQHTVYTVVERVPSGENLREHLNNPRMQTILHALGRTQASYFEQIGPEGFALEDTSGHYQYSTEGSLYDISYAATSDAAIVADDIAVAQEWIGKLPPNPERDTLLGRFATLVAQYPLDEQE